MSVTVKMGQVRQGAEDFLAALKEGGTTATNAEADLFTLGHFNGATTVLGILEDLLLSETTGAEKMVAIQQLLEECAVFANDRRDMLQRYKRDAEALAEMSKAPDA